MKTFVKTIISLIFILWAFVAAYTIPGMKKFEKRIGYAVIIIHAAALFGLWGIL